MKKIKFLNILILIIFFSLSSCYKESSIEKKDYLKVMSNAMLDERRDFFSSEELALDLYDKENIPPNQNPLPEKVSEEDYLRLIEIFEVPKFIDRLIEIIRIKAPGKNIFSFLNYIKDRNDGFALYRMLKNGLVDVLEYKKMSDSDERKKKIDNQWERFKKIACLDNTLNDLLVNFDELVKIIRSKANNNEIYLNALSRCNDFFDQRIRPYNNKSIEDLKKDEDFLILIHDSLSLIAELSKLKLEEERSLSLLESDLILLRDFFQEIKNRRDFGD